MNALVKRVIAVMLALVMALGSISALTACNTGGTETETENTNKGDEEVNDPTANTSEGGLTVSALKVNETSNPIGIDTNPVFSWRNSANGYGKSQSAYRITVSTSDAGEAYVWDSGKVESSVNYSVGYSGDTKLKSASTYYWKVTVWDNSGDSVTSNAAVFKTGMFSDTDWKGDWITAKSVDSIEYGCSGAYWIWDNGSSKTNSANSGYAAATKYFRSKINIDGTIRSAVLCFTADDYGSVYVNGKEICIVPNQTDIWKSGNVIDVKGELVSGDNIIAAAITNSSVGYAGFVAKLTVVLENGTTKNYVTNGSDWLLSSSAADGWTSLGFDDSSWVAPTQTVSYGGSPWTNQATFSSGNDRAAHLLRTEFDVSKEVAEAMAYVCGLGYFELSINGELADDSLLNPCNTQYNMQVLYRTFDVTSLVKSGRNAIGIELGNGFYNEQGGVWNWASASWRDNPKALVNVIITYTDGSVDTVVSGTDWKGTTGGPITFNSIYYGETYDARLEQKGWNRAGFDAAGWSFASKADAPEGTLVCQIEDPIRRTAEYSPDSIKKLSDGSYVVKVPEYVTGWAKIGVKGAKSGDEITVTYAEKINSNGSVVKMGGSNGVSASWWPEFYIQTDTYISNGSDAVYEPKFSYYGFNYFQIWNYPGKLSADDITIYRVSNDVEVTGSFECSNELLNNLHHMMIISTQNNLQGKPTDCPVWEKNGWLGDCNVMLDSLSYNFDMSNFMRNYVEIMQSCFEQYGILPQMVPTADWGVADHYVWNSLYVFAVENLATNYGMTYYMEEQYDTMSEYATNIAKTLRRAGWICSAGQLGDWVSPMGGENDAYNESPNEGSAIVGTAYLYAMYSSMARMAMALGKTSDASAFSKNAKNIYDAFNEKFYNARQGYYESSEWSNNGPKRTKYRQTSQLVAIAFGLVPDKYLSKVAANLVKDVESKDYHLDTGCVGAKEILPVLCNLGYADVAYKIATQTTYPSWGFMYEKGNGSLWEMWETSARSLGHYFLGSYDEWFYQYLAGITDVTAGYESFTIAPCFIEGLDSVSCTEKTVRGLLESSWTREWNAVTMTVVVPFGSTANVVIPEGASFSALNGVPVSESMNGVYALSASSVTIGSGSYTITVSLG